MINYLSKFSPRLSELAEPIRELSKDKVPFNWGPEHQKAFTQMKKEFSSAPILAITTPRNKLCCRQMPASKVLVLFYFKMANLFILQAKPYLKPRKGMLLLKLNCLQWLGQWRSSTTFLCQPCHLGN